MAGDAPSTSASAAGEKKEQEEGKDGEEKEDEDMVSFEDTQGTVAYSSQFSMRFIDFFQGIILFAN